VDGRGLSASGRSAAWQNACHMAHGAGEIKIFMREPLGVIGRHARAGCGGIRTSHRRGQVFGWE